jgi:hypothetical protein
MIAGPSRPRAPIEKSPPEPPCCGSSLRAEWAPRHARERPSKKGRPGWHTGRKPGTPQRGGRPRCGRRCCEVAVGTARLAHVAGKARGGALEGLEVARDGCWRGCGGGGTVGFEHVFPAFVNGGAVVEILLVKFVLEPFVDSLGHNTPVYLYDSGGEIGGEQNGLRVACEDRLRLQPSRAVGQPPVPGAWYRIFPVGFSPRRWTRGRQAETAPTTRATGRCSACRT